MRSAAPRRNDVSFALATAVATFPGEARASLGTVDPRSREAPG